MPLRVGAGLVHAGCGLPEVVSIACDAFQRGAAAAQQRRTPSAPRRRALAAGPPPPCALALSSRMALHMTIWLRAFFCVLKSKLTYTKICLVFQENSLRRSAVRLSTMCACGGGGGPQGVVVAA